MIFFKTKKIYFYHKMDEESILKLTRDQCIGKLRDIGQHSLGTLEEMKMRLRKFSLYPKLYQRPKLKAQ